MYSLTVPRARNERAGCHHQMLLPNQPNCGCRATRTERGITCRFTILRCRCCFSSRLPGSDGCSRFASDGCIKANASRSRSFSRGVGNRRRTGDTVLHDRGRRGNDRRKGGIENDALRPFAIGMNADNGRIDVRSLADRQFGQACVQNEHQREQYSTDIKEISRQRHALYSSDSAPASTVELGYGRVLASAAFTSMSSNP